MPCTEVQVIPVASGHRNRQRQRREQPEQGQEFALSYLRSLYVSYAVQPVDTRVCARNRSLPCRVSNTHASRTSHHESKKLNIHRCAAGVSRLKSRFVFSFSGIFFSLPCESCNSLSLSFSLFGDVYIRDTLFRFRLDELLKSQRSAEAINHLRNRHRSIWEVKMGDVGVLIPSLFVKNYLV